MNAKKAKAIRRALREYKAAGSGEYWQAHPRIYDNVRGERMLKYKFQYFTAGYKKLVQAAKKIYRASGMLPRMTNG